LIAQDHLINEKRFAIEADALSLIATQQPMAGDLRTLAAVLDIASEIERIGDYAKGIAKINLMIGQEPFIEALVDLPAIASKARDMFQLLLSWCPRIMAARSWQPKVACNPSVPFVVQKWVRLNAYDIRS